MVWPIVVLFLMVLGAIYSGAATATEAAGVGATGALLIALAQRKVTWSGLRQALITTARYCGFLGLIYGGALVFVYPLSYSGVPHQLASFIVGLPPLGTRLYSSTPPVTPKKVPFAPLGSTAPAFKTAVP